MIRSFFMAVLALSIAGCGTLSYREPAGGPRARVRFVSDSTAVTVLRAYDDQNCATGEVEWMRLRDGPLINSAPKRLGMPDWRFHDNAAKEVDVETNRSINAMFHGAQTSGLTTYSCAVSFFYTFPESGDFEVRDNWHPSACRVTIHRLERARDEAAGGREIASFTNKSNEQNRGCLAVFRKPRPY